MVADPEHMADEETVGACCQLLQITDNFNARAVAFCQDMLQHLKSISGMWITQASLNAEKAYKASHL